MKEIEKNKENRLLFDAAMARIAGEMIIEHVENQISEFYQDEILA